MAKRNRTTTVATIQRRHKEGRGQGTGSEYKPWLRIQDVSSQGRSHRILGLTTGRVHHLLSDLERDFFLVYDWDPAVMDIREQYPLLPREDTQTIAQEFGIKHPTDPHSREPIVMTTDFLITVRTPEGERNKAVDVKHSTALTSRTSKRTLEKLKIAQIYWESAGIPWCVVTEKERDLVAVTNIRLLRQHDTLRPSHREPAIVDAALRVLSQRLCREHKPLRVITRECDAQFNLERGTSLSCAYHLLATRKVPIDIRQPIQPGKPLCLLLP